MRPNFEIQKKSRHAKENPPKSPAAKNVTQKSSNFLSIKNNKSTKHQENARYFMRPTLFIPRASVTKL